MKFYGKKEQNKIKYHNPRAVMDYIEILKDGQEICIDLKIKRKFRSMSQNNLYWKWLEIIGDDLGYTSEDLHSTFKAMFLTDNTREIPIVRSTTALDTKQFTIYLNKIEELCKEKFNMVLPHPDDLYM
jgi:hypothetical protein